MRGLVEALQGRLRVIQLNVDEEVGRRARTVYGTEKVPAVIMLSAGGSEVYRSEGKLPRTGEIREKLAELEAA